MSVNVFERWGYQTSSVLTLPRMVSDDPGLDEDEYCHIVHDSGCRYCDGGPDPTRLCGDYQGEEECDDCGRTICPECVVLAELEESLSDVPD